jgi:hypothetical protein
MQGSAYSQFKRALKRQNFMLAWTMASELPKVQLADALALLLLARDLEPARFDLRRPYAGARDARFLLGVASMRSPRGHRVWA